MRKPFLILLSCCLVGVGIYIVQNRTEYSKPGYSVFYWDGQNYKEEEKDTKFSLRASERSERVEKLSLSKPEQEIDFDGDGTDEKIELDDGTVFIYKGEDVWWQSDPDWQVENIILADLNWDGKIELNMSLWKRGSFGDDLPFWVEENDTDLGNHFFIYGFKKGEIRPIWCSSTIDYPIREMTASDINGDGKDELIVLEGSYDQPQDALAKYVSIWSWNGWGFSCDFRNDEGRFYDLRIGQGLDNGNYIAVRGKP